jgi:Na+(H+)/acetate symporter ActP
MNILLAGVVSILTAATPAQPQAPTGLINSGPLTITFVNTVTLDEALSTLSKVSGVVMEIGSTVPEDVRKQPLSESSPISMRNVTLEQMIDTLTRLKGLSFAVVNEKLIFIFKKP